MEAHEHTARARSSRAIPALVAGIVGVCVPLLLFWLGSQSSDPSGGLVTALIALGLICSIVAIVLGVVARQATSRDPSLGGRGEATAGIVTGIVGVLFVGFVGVVLLTGQTLY